MGERLGGHSGDFRENAAVLSVPQDRLNMIQARKWELQKNWYVPPYNILNFACLKQANLSGKVLNVSFVVWKSCWAACTVISLLSMRMWICRFFWFFPHYNDKENKGANKNQCLYHQYHSTLAVGGSDRVELLYRYLNWCWISGSSEQVLGLLVFKCWCFKNLLHACTNESYVFLRLAWKEHHWFLLFWVWSIYSGAVEFFARLQG